MAASQAGHVKRIVYKYEEKGLREQQYIFKNICMSIYYNKKYFRIQLIEHILHAEMMHFIAQFHARP